MYSFSAQLELNYQIATSLHEKLFCHLAKILWDFIAKALIFLRNLKFSLQVKPKFLLPLRFHELTIWQQHSQYLSITWKNITIINRDVSNDCVQCKNSLFWIARWRAFRFYMAFSILPAVKMFRTFKRYFDLASWV